MPMSQGRDMGTRFGFGGGLGDEAGCFEGFVGVEFVGFFEHVFYLGGGEVGGEGLGAVGDGVGCGSGGGDALGEVCLDYGVEGVGGLVVEFEVFVDAGPEDEGGDAEEVESGVVGFEEELGVGAGLVGAEASEEGFDVGEGLLFVFASHEVPAFGGLGTGVGDEDGVDGGHVGEVLFGVGVGANEALLFSAEEHEA